MTFKPPGGSGGAPWGSGRAYYYHHDAAAPETSDNFPYYNHPLSYAALALIGLYTLLHYLNIFPTLSLPELVWNALVYATPASLVLALEARKSPSSRRVYAETRTFAAKSEAMRTVLGLSGDGLLAYGAQRTRRLSGLGGILKSAGSGPGSSLPGLGNWDNSCYQNSILQGLAALPSLHGFLAHTAKTLRGAETRATSAALQQLIEDLNSPKNLGRKIWAPAVLKSMSSWQQQDAQEYFSKVVDTLEKELAKGIAESAKQVGLDMGSTASAATGPENKPFRNPLEGMLAQRVGCLRCGYAEGLSLIPFNCLTLPLGHQNSYNLEACLDGYTGLEPISGVECPHCTLLRQKEVLEKLVVASASATTQETIDHAIQERLTAVNTALGDGDFSDATLSQKCSIPSKQRVHTTKTRQAVIARAPKALAIHVNRSLFDESTGALSKNYASVHFPRFLDLSRWSLGVKTGDAESWSTNPAQSMLDGGGEMAQIESHAASSQIYALQAVVTHHGRHENGHYIAYRKNQVSQDDASHQSWWRLSDENVSMSSEDTVLAQGGVFMLFYEMASDAEITSYLRRDAASVGIAEDDHRHRYQDQPPVATPHLPAAAASQEPHAVVPARTTSLPSPHTLSPATKAHSTTSASRSASPLPVPLTPSQPKAITDSTSFTPTQAVCDPPVSTSSSPSVSGTTASLLSSPSIPTRKTSKPKKKKKKSKDQTEGDASVNNSPIPRMRTSGGVVEAGGTATFETRSRGMPVSAK